MAGIGFALRKLMEPGTYTAYVRAYAYAAIVGTGPWLLSVVCLAVLGAVAVDPDDFVTRQTFASTVVYIFGGTLVLTGPLQMVVTRYLADRIYRGEQGQIGASYLPVLLCTAVPLLVIGALFFGGLTTSLFFRLVATGLFVTIGCLWMVMVFLTTSNEYAAVVRIFALGTALSIGGGIAGGRHFGLDGYLLGYAVGQFAIFGLLTRLVLDRFGGPVRWDFGFLGHLRLYPSLAVIGFAYNLAVWADKFAFWVGVDGDLSGTVAGRLTTTPRYDSSMFMGFLTVVPAMTHFLLVVETELAGAISGFYDAIFYKRPLKDIRTARLRLETMLRRAFVDILRIQALITVLCIFFGADILQLLDLPMSQLGMFRFACVGSLFVAFTLFCLVVLLYLDRRTDALAVALLFLLLNSGLSLASLALGYVFYGAGFAFSGMLALLLAVGLLMHRIQNLEFLTFSGTPIIGQQAATAALRAGPGRGYGREHAL